MRGYDALSHDAERNLEIVTAASQHASLCLALCTSCVGVHPLRENGVCQCLDTCLNAIEASYAAIRWSIQTSYQERLMMPGLLSALRRIPALCGDICELCAEMCETYIPEGERREHHRICADLCRAYASDCRGAIATIH